MHYWLRLGFEPATPRSKSCARFNKPRQTKLRLFEILLFALILGCVVPSDQGAFMKTHITIRKYSERIILKMNTSVNCSKYETCAFCKKVQKYETCEFCKNVQKYETCAFCINVQKYETCAVCTNFSKIGNLCILQKS